MFLNDFYKASVLGNTTIRGMKTYPGCALVYDCVCSANSHCAKGQKCIDVPLPANKTAKICLDNEQQAGLMGIAEALVNDFNQHS